MQTQYNLTAYRIGLYFYDYNKLAVEIDENRIRNEIAKINRKRSWL